MASDTTLPCVRDDAQSGWVGVTASSTLCRTRSGDYTRDANRYGKERFVCTIEACAVQRLGKRKDEEHSPINPTHAS